MLFFQWDERQVVLWPEDVLDIQSNYARLSVSNRSACTPAFLSLTSTHPPTDYPPRTPTHPPHSAQGFDLTVLPKMDAAARNLFTRGMHLMLRLFEFPIPVVVGCAGHALALGAILLFTSDIRIGWWGTMSPHAQKQDDTRISTH